MRRRAELALSLAALAGAIVLTNVADRYVERAGESSAVSPDFVLSRLPAVDASWLYW